MADNISKKERSRVMSLVKQKDTKPEVQVRSFLHRSGLRFRLHDKKLPGKPDLVFPKYKSVLFVHGCFWHGHTDTGCRLSRIPKSNIPFWEKKIEENRKRDVRNTNLLREMSWNVLTIWECQLKSREALELLAQQIRTANMKK